MTTCPDTGRLRAWIDGEASPTSPDEASHVAACAGCLQQQDELQRDATLAAAMISTLAPLDSPDPAAVEAALDAVRGRRSAPGPDPAHRRRPRPAALSRMVAGATCLAVTGLVATPTGRSATAALDTRSDSGQPAVVAVDPRRTADALHDLERLGTVTGKPAEPQPVADLAEAERVAGLAVAKPDLTALPDSVRPTPTILAGRAQQVRVTFSGAHASEPSASLGGAVLVINVPAMVIQYYPAVEDTPGLVIAEAEQLTAQVEGDATLDQVRSYLLSHPDLPAETVAQLRAITDRRTTLPITVPANETMRRDTTVAGGHALLFGDDSSHASTVIWQRDGRIHAVGGTLDAQEVQRVANALR